MRIGAEGVEASLEGIARDAGVGIGTLYRHFPTRAALVEAVYRQEVARLGESARKLAEREPPLEALRAWLMLFVDYLATKKLVAAALVDCNATAATGEVLDAAITPLVRRAEEAGAIRLTLPPLDLLRAIAGVANVGAGVGWEAGARAMVDVLIAGVAVN